MEDRFPGSLSSEKHQRHSTMHHQLQSNLLRLPSELRIAMYEYILDHIKTQPLYIARDVWTWKKPCTARSQHSRGWRFLNLLLSCRRIHNEAADTLYRKHGLCLIVDCTQDLSSQCLVRRRICPIEGYANVLKRVHSIRLKLFLTGELCQANVIVALLSWIKAVFAERHTPLERMTVEFCATCWKLECRPTAVIYTAQGLRDLAPARFEFQCGFSGMETEDAVIALAEHANKKRRIPIQPLSSEEALERLLQAWSKTVRTGMLHIQAPEVC